MSRYSLLSAALLIWVSACSGTDDSGGGADAGPGDAGRLDAGTQDGGEADAGPDAGFGFQWGATPDDYLPQDLRYVNQLTVPAAAGGGESCCADYTGDGVPDNKWAALLRLASSVGVDAQASIDSALQAGQLVLLLDTVDPGAGAGGGGDARLVAKLEGVFDAPTLYSEANAGQGRFLILRSSFLTGSGEPAEHFAGSLAAGKLQVPEDAAASNFTLSFPFFGASLALPLTRVQLKADDAAGSYTHGSFAGVLPIAKFYGAINAFVASPACACLGLSSPLYAPDGSGGFTPACVANASSLCSLPAEVGCLRLAANISGGGSCGMLGNMIAGDVDLDGDPSRLEGISVGLQWSAVPTAAVSVEP